MTEILARTTGTRSRRSAEGAQARRRAGTLRALCRDVAVAEPVLRYASRLVRASDPPTSTAPELVRRALRFGAGVRGAQSLVLASKALALLEGRAHVAFADVQRVAKPVLRHRLIRSFEGEADGITTDQVVEAALIEAVPTRPGAVQQAAPAAPAPLLIDAVPLLGPGSPAGERWLTVVVRLINTTDQQLEGHVEVTSEQRFSGADRRLRTRAPFAVAGKGRVTLVLPTHGFMHTPPQLSLHAFDGKGKEIAAANLPDPRPLEPTLFDLTLPSRVGPGLRGMRVAAQHTAPFRSSYSYTAPALGVSSPQVNAATGDPVLPDRPAGYAPATLVLAKSDQLTALQGAELDALTHWVLGGGSLAVVVTRPEDLRSPLLTAMAGGAITSEKAARELSGQATFVVPTDTGGGYGYAPRNVEKRAAPSNVVSTALTGYGGGNLTPSPWGATASYGMGELTLLAFDATKDPAASDEWVRLKLVDLTRHAWDRQVSLALPHGASALDTGSLDAIRKHLDPNEGARWAVVVALLLLIAYSMLAGPLNFYLASKKGKPLRALWHLPIWSGVTMGAIVVLGAVAKGVSGRARHLTVIEAAAGMTRGSVTRFRGFYTSAAEQLLVRASDRQNVLDVAGDDAAETSRELVVDRDGARLVDVAAPPGRRWSCAKTASRRSARGSPWPAKARAIWPSSTGAGAICAR
jgi:hypothetical protein